MSSSYIRFGIDRHTKRPFCSDVNGKKHYDIENYGYTKELKIRIVTAKKQFRKRIPNTDLEEIVYAYCYEEWLARAVVCVNCEGKEESYDYLQKTSIKTPCAYTCFRVGTTSIYSDFTNEKKWKRLSSRPITLEEIFEKFEKGELDYIEPAELWHILEDNYETVF